MKFLLIEDDNLTIESLKLCMAFYESGSALVSTNKGKEAAQMLKNEHFDAVIIDLGLPDIDGIEVLKQIRSFSNIPAVVLTARHSYEAMTAAKELGADDFITKPFNYRLLLGTLHGILDNPDSRRIKGIQSK
jgi:two-component system, OmpR family, KDP operon response regulator KdpE